MPTTYQVNIPSRFADSDVDLADVLNNVPMP
jgi:hypothetical protein